MCAVLVGLQKKENMFDFFLNLIQTEMLQMMVMMDRNYCHPNRNHSLKESCFYLCGHEKDIQSL